MAAGATLGLKAALVCLGVTGAAMAAPSLLLSESAGRATRLFARARPWAWPAPYLVADPPAFDTGEVIAVARAIGNGDTDAGSTVPGGEMAALARPSIHCPGSEAQDRHHHDRKCNSKPSSTACARGSWS
jgi:hypothetical protein